MPRALSRDERGERSPSVFWAGKMEEIGELIVNGQEALRLSRRFEPLHDPLSSPRRLMRIFRSVIQAFVLAILDPQRHVPAGRAIRGQFVRDHDARRPGGLSQQFAHEPAGGFSVATALNENVENEAVLIDGAPEPVFLAGDRDDDFVHMPFVASLWARRRMLDEKSRPNFSAHRRIVS